MTDTNRPAEEGSGDVGPADTIDESLRTQDATDQTWKDAVVVLIPSLRAFAWSLSHNGEETDHLVQETLIKGWSQRDEFEPGANLRIWLFVILRTTYTTVGNRPSRLARAGDAGVPKAALDRLPDTQREALILVGGAGLTYEEAAQVCGCALGAIKSRIRRGRAGLAKIIEADRARDALAGDPHPLTPIPPD